MYATALGCKLNQSEAESWSRELADVGCEHVRDAALADLCIVNTCCVTSMAARRSRQAVRRCTRANPDTSVVVTGCYAEVDPSAAALLPGVSSVLRMTEKDSLVQIISHQWGLPEGRTTSAVTRRPRASSFQSDCRHTRAFVKVQDGCDNTCAY